MKPIPRETYDFDCPLSLNEALAALQANVKTPGDPAYKLFNGTLTENRFEIRRRVWYSKTFVPQIVGEVISGTEGCHIKSQITLTEMGRAFYWIWAGFSVLTALMFLTHGIQAGQAAWGIVKTVFLGPLAFGFGWAITTISFAIEARFAKAALHRFLPRA